MLNKEELKSFQEESLIDSWYNNRAENLYILNDVDKKKIEEITKGEDTYQIIADEISKLANKDDKEKILEKIDKHCNKLVILVVMKMKNFIRLDLLMELI